MIYNFEYKKIGDICKIKTGKLDANASSVGGLYPFFTCSKENLYINTFSYDEECVLISGNGDLNVKYYKGKFDAYQRTYIITLKNKELKISVLYLFRFFSKYVEYLRKISVGGVIKYIKLNNLTDAIVPIPPIEEQERIVAELDLISGVIEKQKAQLKELDNLAQSIFYDMFGDPIKNDKGWNVDFLKIVAPQKLFYGIVPKQNGKVWLLNLDMVAQQTGEIINRVYVDESEVGNSTMTFDTSNVLYSKLRPYLNKVVVPDNIGFGTTELVPLQPQKNILDRFFFANLLRSQSFVDYISVKVAGAKMPRVSMDVLRNFKVILPPLDLQESFAQKIQAIEQQKECIKESIKEMETLLQSRMDYYFD